MKKKIVLILIFVLLIEVLGIKSTYSKLNITYTKDMTFVSKSYIPLTIVSTEKKDSEKNSYTIVLQNNNDYNVNFSCISTNPAFNVICDKSHLGAKSNSEINVALESKEGTSIDTTCSSDGENCKTRIGIRITYPYAYPKDNPQDVISDEISVSESTVLPSRSFYDDYIWAVYPSGEWGTHVTTLAGTTISSFDKKDGAALFDANTYGIDSNKFKIKQISIYDFNWKLVAVYEVQRSDWGEVDTWSDYDNVYWYKRHENYQFKRHLSPDFDHIGGSETLDLNDGMLRFIIIVDRL